jgi:hypothetical protein
MSPTAEPSQRLQRLAQILAESKLAIATSEVTDPADAHIASLPLERIRRLTLELTSRAAAAIDEIDGLAMRLLLNEYSVAVAHLREVARLAEQKIAAATIPILETRRHVRGQKKRAEVSLKSQERAPARPPA